MAESLSGRFLTYLRETSSKMHLSSGHSFHIVDVSPWPLVGSASALLLTGGLVC